MKSEVERIITTILQSDGTITDTQKRRVLQILRNEPGEAPQAPPIKKLLKRGEVAQMLGCTPQSVDYYCRKGWLKKVTLGSQSRASGIPEDAVREFVKGKVTRKKAGSSIA